MFSIKTLTPPPPPQRNILETERVNRMGNEPEERKIEGVDSDNEGEDNEVLSTERKGYRLRNPSNVNYRDKRATQRSMGWNNIFFGSNELHSVAKEYVNVFNDIASLVKPTPPTNIITKRDHPGAVQHQAGTQGRGCSTEITTAVP